MPYYSRGEVFGDLIFKFNIVYPKNINKKDIDKFKELLPESMFDNFTTETKKTYKLETYKKSHNFDNEEEEQRGPGCQQQ